MQQVSRRLRMPETEFGTGILIKRALPKGGVHKIQILIRDLLKEFLQKIFGEEKGGVRGIQTPLLKNQ